MFVDDRQMFDTCLGDSNVGVRVAALKAACSFLQDVYVPAAGEFLFAVFFVLLVFFCFFFVVATVVMVVVVVAGVGVGVGVVFWWC